jgi:hypothetical protein
VQDLFDWTFRLVACAFTFSLSLILGVLYTIPEGASQAQPAPASATVAKAEEFPNLNMRLRYPAGYAAFEEGFSPEFRKSFHTQCGKFPSKGTVGEACHVSFDVMVNHHFGSLSKDKLDEIMKDETHEEWVKFAQVTPELQSKLERALAPVMMRRMVNKTFYE